MPIRGSSAIPARYGKGKGSDVRTDVRVADAYEVEDGKIRRAINSYTDVAAALDAVGQAG